MVEARQDTNKAFSLRETCKQRIKSMVQTVKQKNKDVKGFWLVLDSNTLKMVSSFMKNMELLELDIWDTEKLEFQRQAYPNQHAIYLLSPTESSVDLLVADFASKKDYKYGLVHLFFTNKISKTLMVKISQNAVLLERVKTFQELNLDFCCKFDNTINLAMPEALPVLFGEAANQRKNMLQIVADKLSTVISSFEKFYAIEIVYNLSDNGISQAVANDVYSRLSEIEANLKLEKSETLDRSAGKITLLILDRSIDPLTPVMHDFFYQSMLYDLLEVEGDKVKYAVMESANANEPKKRTEKLVALRDSDDFFSRYKYRHIAEAMEGVAAESRDFAEKNSKAAQLQSGQKELLQLSDLSEILRGMPQYKELMSNFQMHISLIQECMQILHKKDLNSIGELEQTFATGVDAENKVVAPSKLLQLVGARLISDNLSDYDKLRLCIICTICIDMVEKDRKALTDLLNPNDLQAILNLRYLGVNPQQGSSKNKSKSKGKIDKKIQKIAMSKAEQQTLKLCRHTTHIEMLLEELLSQNNLASDFKTLSPQFRSLKLNDAPESKAVGSLKNKKLLNLLGPSSDGSVDYGNSVPKLIIFFVGGVAFSELRAIYNSERLRDAVCIVGGTDMITPKDYIEGLKKMRSGV